MIVVKRKPKPTVRIVRIVTVDARGRLRRWDPGALAAAHPELGLPADLPVALDVSTA